MASEIPGRCSACAAELSPEAQGGLCPKCLLSLGLSERLAQTQPLLEERPGVDSLGLDAHSAVRLPQSALGRVRYFGDYELLKEIARGGMGIVFKARQISLNRFVALKLISGGALATADLAKRFRAEAEAAASLSHPNIVPIYEIGEHQGQHYFSMGLIEGLNLHEALSQVRDQKSKLQNPSYEPRRAAQLVATIARAVHYAHQRGVLHRDIKSSNILLDAQGEPHLTDFGLAKLVEKESTLTHTNAVMGTPAYMAPEQARGETKDLTTATDVYGLGAVLYETLTGSPPFGGGTSMETIRQVLDQEPRRPSLCTSGLDRDLETICVTCLEKDPQRRYASADLLANELDRWLKGEPIQARPSTAIERTIKWIKRKPAVAGLASAMVLVVLAGSTAVLWQRHEVESARRETESARRVAEKRADAEMRANAKEQEERKKVQGAYAETAEVLAKLDLEKAEQFFREDQARTGVAYLARALRGNPTNRRIVGKIMAALSRHSFLFPLAEYHGASLPSFSADGQLFLMAFSNRMEVFDSKTLIARAKVTNNEGAQISFAVVSPDNRRVLIGTGGPGQEETGRLWELGAFEQARKLMVRKGDDPSFGGWQFSPDGSRVLTSFNVGGNLLWEIWDRNLGEPLFRQQTDGLRTLARFSLDGRRTLLASGTGVQSWDCMTGQLTSRLLKPGNQIDLRALALTPDGERLLTTSGTTVQVWNVATGEVLWEVPPMRTSYYFMWGEFSRDAQEVLVASSKGTVGILDAATGESVGKLIELNADISSAHFTRNCQGIMTVASGSGARLWDAHTGLPLSAPLYSADKGNDYRPLRSGFVNADGRLVITWAAGSDETSSTVVLWELRSGYPSIVVPDSGGVDASWPASDPSRGHAEHESEALSVPDWLPALAEAVAGFRLTAKGIESMPIPARLEARHRLSQLTGDDSYSRFARWFFADIDSRSVTLFSEIIGQQYVQRCLEEDRLEGLYSASRLDPVNGRLLAQLARHLLQQDPLENPRHQGEADYFSRDALALAPSDMLALSIRSDVLAAQGRLDEALQIIETRESQRQRDPDFWHQKGLILEKAARFEEAAEAYVRAVELSGTIPDWSKLKRARYRLDYSELLRAQDRTIEAESAAETALALQRDASTQDWPMWGGTDAGRNLYSPAAGLPATFQPGKINPDTQEVDLSTTRNVKWVTRLGSQSYGNVTVASGKVFIGMNNDIPRDRRHLGDRGILLCLDENAGNFCWQLVIPKLASGKVNDWEGLGLLSSPAVEGNRVYIASSRCEVLCLTTDGLARRNVGPFKEEGHYVVGPGKMAVQPTRRDADIVWRYDMIDELGVFPHKGMFTAPLIVDDLIYLKTCNGVDWTHSNIPSPFAPSLIAVNKKTGELAGVDDADIGPRILHSEWGSPSAGKVNGTNLIFFGGGDGFCYALQAEPVMENGPGLLKKVWWADCNPQEYRFKLNGEIAEKIKYSAADGPSEIIGTPVFWKNRVYVATGQDPDHGEGVGNLVCIDATQTGNVTKTGILWRNKDLHRSMSTVGITPDGLLFIVDFSGFVHCIDADTGRSFWKHDMKAHVWGSTLVADGKVYVGDADGDFVVLAASKEKRILSKLIRDGKEEDGPNLGTGIYTTPVVANGVLYVANHTHLYAIWDASKMPPYRTAKVGLSVKVSD